MSKQLVLFFALLSITGHSTGQYLDKISPVFLTQGSPAHSLSFILTATDYNAFRGLKVKYPSSLQIIDASQPWPPRWFATAPFDLGDITPDTLNGPMAKPLINASLQEDKITFLSTVRFKDKTGRIVTREAIIYCNRNMAFADTFVIYNQSVDTHDFRINPADEKLYFSPHDTILDMGHVFNDLTDSVTMVSYQNIEIKDSNNRIIFSWNPLLHFSLNAMYGPYRYTPGTMSNSSSIDWSHGSSLCWDVDGNILYSYKHIGIGKISRKTGHIIWHIDRNKQRPDAQSDTIPIFMQHDFKSTKAINGQVIYTVLSNGDSTRPFTTAYQFTVKESSKHEPVFKLLKKFEPETPVINTGAGGNYDIEPDGSYLINYGAFEGDSSANRLLFECRDKNDKITAQYKVPPRIICYRVHKINDSQIKRPVVKMSDGGLYTDDKLKLHTWYRLSGFNNTTATKVGAGARYKPTESGVYCVTEQCGVGYSVSLPIKFDR